MTYLSHNGLLSPCDQKSSLPVECLFKKWAMVLVITSENE